MFHAAEVKKHANWCETPVDKGKNDVDNLFMNEIFISTFDYELPHERIAEFPLEKRNQSRLLVYKEGIITDDHFYNIGQYIPPASTVVINDTKVIEARILFTKPSGGVIEIFCLQPHLPSEMASAMTAKSPVQWKCLIGGASKWKPGQLLQKDVFIDDHKVSLVARYITKETEDFIIELSWNSDHRFAEVVHVAGAIPLPPYIKRKAVEKDAERYQTVFADEPGSVAAPTAALHFTENELKDLREKEVSVEHITLHVGAGTFKPVKSETVSEHQMHAEHFHVSLDTLQCLSTARNIIAVGTTSLRTLESLYWLGKKISDKKFELSLSQWEAYDMTADLSYKQAIDSLIEYARENKLQELHCQTSLLIRPGYKMKSAGALITNFHQPRSTLLLLVAAFIGDDWHKVYDHALKNDYRFLSYGDSSLLFRNN